MQIHIEKTGETKEVVFQGTAKQLLDKLAINHTTVIIAADRKLVALESDVSKAKRIDILSVVSGG